MADDRSNDMALPVATGLTIADLESQPEDMRIRNLVDGELFVTPAPTTRHQRVVVRLINALCAHEAAHGGKVFTAPCEVRLSATDVPQPDVFFLNSDGLDRVAEQYVDGPPDLVIEVSSPSTRRLDQVRKRRQYERFAVPEYWFVDLDADRVEVYRLAGDRFRPPEVIDDRSAVRSSSVAGLVIDVATMLAG